MVEQLRVLASTSASKAEVLRGLGYSTKNAGNYKTLAIVAEKNDIELPDGTGTGNANRAVRRPIEELLVEGGTMSSYHLKNRLLREGLMEPKCYAPFCPVPNPSINPFTGEECELKLALDHIDGNPRNNKIDNLRLLCYHCHGLTPTYCNSKRGL